eukprot:gene11532-biopygen12420
MERCSIRTYVSIPQRNAKPCMRYIGDQTWKKRHYPYPVCIRFFAGHAAAYVRSTTSPCPLSFLYVAVNQTLPDIASSV